MFVLVRQAIRHIEYLYNRVQRLPAHSTVVISLWALQFKFPEDSLAKDISQALHWARRASSELHKLCKGGYDRLRKAKDDASQHIREETAAARGAILACFSLVEAYFNGIAWQFAQDKTQVARLSGTKRKLIEDGSRVTLLKKLKQYPKLITGVTPSRKYLESVDAFMGVMKPFRDSLVHPSPFSMPEKFGGYDKLTNLYRIDLHLVELTLAVMCDLLTEADSHLRGDKCSRLKWLDELNEERKYMFCESKD